VYDRYQISGFCISFWELSVSIICQVAGDANLHQFLKRGWAEQEAGTEYVDSMKFHL